MVHGLGGMGVEAVVWGSGIEDARAETGQVRLGNVLHVLADRRVGIRHVRRVFGRRRCQDVRPLEGVSAGTADITDGIVMANGWTIHARKDVQRLRSLILSLDT